MKNLILLGLLLFFLASFVIFKVQKQSQTEIHQNTRGISETSIVKNQEKIHLESHLSKQIKLNKAELLSALDNVPDPDELYELRLSPNVNVIEAPVNFPEAPATIPETDVIPDELVELELNYALNKSNQDYLDPRKNQSNALTEGLPSGTGLPPSITQDKIIPFELELLEIDFKVSEGDQSGRYQEPLWDDPVTETMFDPG